MLQLCRELDLAAEPFAVDAGRELRRQHLDHDLPVERAFPREEYAAHPPARQFAFEDVGGLEWVAQLGVEGAVFVHGQVRNARAAFATRAAASERCVAAAAICSVLALCSSLAAATSCIAFANDRVPPASESSRSLISPASALPAPADSAIAVVHDSASATPVSTCVQLERPSSVAACTLSTAASARALDSRAASLLPRP